MKTTFNLFENPYHSTEGPNELSYDNYWKFTGPVCSTTPAPMDPVSERNFKNMSGTGLKSRDFIFRYPDKVLFIRRYSDGTRICNSFNEDDLIHIIDNGSLYDKRICMNNGGNRISFYLSNDAVKYLYEWREFVKWRDEMHKFIINEFLRYAGDDFIIRDKIIYDPDFHENDESQTVRLPQGYSMNIKNTDKGKLYIIPDRNIYRSIQIHYWDILSRQMCGFILTDDEVIALGQKMTGARNRDVGGHMTDRDIVECILGEFLHQHCDEFHIIMDKAKKYICEVRDKQILEDFYNLNPGYKINGIYEYMILHSVYINSRKETNASNQNQKRRKPKHSNVIELPFIINNN